MHATLIYNASSGGATTATPETLSEALKKAGYHPIYRATESEEDLDVALASVEGLVVAAGGDGTIRAVATRLIERQVSLAVIPLGTANNIARTLGITGTPEEIIAGLEEPVRLPIDIARVSAPWGQDYFLEAFGYGLYADGLAVYDPEKGKSVLRSFSTLTQLLPGYTAHTPSVRLDGVDFSNHFLLFEILNTPAFGPRIKLAPQADPSDGLLDVVGIREDNRDSLLAYVSSLLSEELADLPSVEARQAKCIEIDWPGSFRFHLDGEVRPPVEKPPPDHQPAQDLRSSQNPEDAPDSEEEGGMVTIDLLPNALELWLPGIEEPPTETRTEEKGEDQENDYLAYLPPR